MKTESSRRRIGWLLPALLWAGLGVAAPQATATVGDERFAMFAPATGAFPLVHEGRAAALLVDSQDYPGVLRVAGDLQADVERVSGVRPDIRRDDLSASPATVIIGTIGKSRLIDRLIREKKVDGTRIAGKWEAYLVQVVAAPLPGIDSALVITGSDKRGTIYGVYSVSEQIGVSPWYWWADVPVEKHNSIFIRPVRHIDEGPAVQYRGIFLNDEAPALTGWVYEKFGKFDHTFYRHVFELILRLRGNYLWPAMWQPRAFNDDDPLNPKLADEYGIVMGTSHHEPLMRAHAEWERYGRGPWNYEKNTPALREFWRGGLERVKDTEKIISIGMRGDGDEPMSEKENVALLERIVADQRQIISDVMGQKPQEVPQLWALYKEVQGYYERGMRVPDDVILLWCDDNWGNIRRLPTPEEQTRAGGAGVYYHFDYVGGPRNYKWLNTIPITKVWEQMHLAWKHQANRIWIVNVGDLKPMEFPIEFFLDYAWNPTRWPYEQLPTYTRTWAAREFGEEHAGEVAALVDGYTRLNGRRKPEMIEPDTLSLVNYREAERVLAEWRDLVARAEKLHATLPAEARDAFYQLVLYPVKASGVVQEIHVTAGLNRLYGLQGRAAANTQSARVRELFDLDQKLVDEYHALGGGRWNHMMAQSNMGYTYWQTPNLEVAPAVSEVRPYADASAAIAIEGSDKSWPSYGAGRAVLPPLHAAAGGTRWIEVFNRGSKAFTYRVAADQPWVTLTPPGGEVAEIARIEVGVDWKSVPRGDGKATITVEANNEKFSVQLPVENPDLAGVTGFLESDRHIAIEAPHFARAIGADGITWQTLPDFGRTLGGVTVMPVTAVKQAPGGNSPRLEYDVVMTSTGEVTVELHCAPSLDFQPGYGLQFAVSFDNEQPQVVNLDTWATLQTWEKAVADGVRKVTTKHKLETRGQHVLKFWMITPGVVLERVILDAGGVRPSYLGPVESPSVGKLAH